MSLLHIDLAAAFRLPVGAGMALIEANRSRRAIEAGAPAPGGGHIDRAVAAARTAKERELRASHRILPNSEPRTENSEPK